jgi:hypothetical protein
MTDLSEDMITGLADLPAPVAGMLTLLPKVSGGFPEDERYRWFVALSLIFDLIYGVVDTLEPAADSRRERKKGTRGAEKAR